MSRLRRYALAAGLLAVWPAFAGGLFGGDASVSVFLGNWTGAGPLRQVAIDQAGPNHVRVHVFGDCRAAGCDWGTALAHNYSEDPGSDAVHAVVAEFDTAGVKRRLTLRQGPGNSLRYDLVTDFANPAAGHDFETEGTLAPAPMAKAPPSATEAPPPAAATQGATGFVESLFSGPSAKTVAPNMAQEDCVALNLNDLYVAPTDHGFEFRDFGHVILNFGPDEASALKAQALVSYYRLDEQCFIARPHPKMIYWKSAGEVPHVQPKGTDCLAVHPGFVKAVSQAGVWKVEDGSAVLLDYGDDRKSAELAVSVIRTYRLTRECFATNRTMQYWLAVPP